MISPSQISIPQPIPQVSTKGGIDRKSILTLTLDFVVGTLAECTTVGKVNAPLGLIYVGATWEDHNDMAGQYLVHCNYEGAQFQQGENGFDPVVATFEFDSGYTEEAIESHPDITEIMRVYGGKIDHNLQVIFPPKLPNTVGQGYSGLSITTAGKRNPMHGRHFYFALKATFRKNYAIRTLPVNFFNKIGTIVNHLPNGFPTPPGRNWLYLPPKAIEKGNVYDVTEELVLSEKGGWVHLCDGMGVGNNGAI